MFLVLIIFTRHSRSSILMGFLMCNYTRLTLNRLVLTKVLSPCSFGDSTLKMYTNGMFPEGFHPIQQSHLPDLTKVAPHQPYSNSSVLYFFNHLRNAVVDRAPDDPLGPKRDILVLVYMIHSFLSQVCHAPHHLHFKISLQ